MRVVLIAAKQLTLAKTRLQAVFPAAERIALAEAMYRDVLGAALGARLGDHVAVISSDVRLLEAARKAGALAIDEEFPRGLNAAVRLATAALVAEGATSVCTLLSDIPLVSAEDIDAAFAARARLSACAEGAGRGAVVLVPSRDLTGTNIIVRAPGDVIPTRFGRLSLARHLEECRRLGLGCEVLRMIRPALDLDVMADLVEFMRTPSATHTFNQLARLGLAHS